MPGQDAFGGPSAVVRIVQPWESEPFYRVFCTLPPLESVRPILQPLLAAVPVHSLQESEPVSRVSGTLPPVGMERRRQERRPCRRTPLKTILTCPSLSRTTSANQAMLRGSTPVCSPPRIPHRHLARLRCLDNRLPDDIFSRSSILSR